MNPNSDKLSFFELLNTIYGASNDERICALLLRIDANLIIGVAQCEELRNALIKFKENANKQIICYMDNLASWGTNGMRHYYLASVATKIFMSDDGLVHLGPLTIDAPFLQSGLKEKFDISVEVRRRSQYKSAANMFVRDEFDSFHKEQYTQLIEHMEHNFIDCISKSREFKPYSMPKNVKTIACIKWIAKQICADHSELKFEIMSDDDNEKNKLLDKAKEEKSADLEYENDEIVSEWNDKLRYLVHCWSYAHGNYKCPKFCVILQFFDDSTQTNVYYKAMVIYPTNERGLLCFIDYLFNASIMSEGGIINSLFASELKYCFNKSRNAKFSFCKFMIFVASSFLFSKMFMYFNKYPSNNDHVL